MANKSRGKPLHGNQPKVRINLRIDSTLKEKAQEANLNFSNILEEALKRELDENSSY